MNPNRHNNRRGFWEFSLELLESLDLDPVYVLLAGAELDPLQLRRWCIAYWLFYHCGTASRISEHKGLLFWDVVASSAGNSKTPRGTERRHFRGEKAITAVARLRERFPRPEAVCDYMFRPTIGAPTPLMSKTVIDRAKELPQFGPWIAFKVADMGERVLRYPIHFEDCALNIYREPLAGINALRVEHPEYTALTIDEIIEAIPTELRRLFPGRVPAAPPWFDRPLNVQEVETMLCKWKSSLNGHYPPLKDIKEILHSDLPSYGKTGARLLDAARKAYPKAVSSQCL